MLKLKKVIREILPAKIQYSGDTDHFELYQINPTQEYRKYMYMGIDSLHRMGWDVNKDRYALMYTDKISSKITAEDIFIRFNRDIPRNFRGRSMSVSDILVLCIGGKRTTYYVDSIGFTELPDNFWES